MSDFSATTEVAAGAAPSAGRMLMQMRQAAGMHLAALALTLKVPADKLEALEADRYEVFTDTIFLRALAASACRVLKQDPAPVLALLPGGAPAPLRIDGGINATFRDSSPRGSFSSSSETPRSRWLLGAVLLLLVGALGLALWPGNLDLQAWLNRPAADAGAQAVGQTGSQVGAQEGRQVVANTPAPATPISTTTQPAAAQPPQVPAALTAAPGPAGAAKVAASAPVAQAGVAGAVGATANPAANPALSPALNPAPAPALQASAGVNPPTAAADSGAALVLRAREASWVQVRNGQTVVLQKTLAAGESLPVPGVAPWSLVIGRADVTEVIVRGTPLNLAPMTRENVARLEIK